MRFDSVSFFRTLEQALRAGFSLRQALERAAGDLESVELARVAEAAGRGEPLDGLLDEWASLDADIALLSGAIRLQLETEANFADTLGVLHAVMARRPRATAPA